MTFGINVGQLAIEHAVYYGLGNAVRSNGPLAQVITKSLDWIIGVILAIPYAICLILRKQKTYVVRRWLGTWKTLPHQVSHGFSSTIIRVMLLRVCV